MAELNLSSIASLLSGNGISTIAKTVGAEESNVKSAVGAALPALISGMQKNVSTESGASSLAKALSDHSGDSTSNVASFLKNVDLSDGAKIVSHILGGSKTSTTSAIAKQSGLTSSKVSQILSMIAPLLLSLIGKKNTGGDSSSAGLGSLLGGILGGSSDLGGLASAAAGLFGGSSESSEKTSSKQSDNKEGGLLDGIFKIFK